MNKVLLDTSAYSNFMAGNNKVLDIISESNIVYLSIFVLAELLTGFKVGNKEVINKELLKKFLLKPTVYKLNADLETAEIFSEIKYHLKKSGNPIPINDIWIAAHTIETGSVLITSDLHFDKISGLRKFNFIKEI